MANSTNLFGWSILYLTAICFIFFKGTLKNDKINQNQAIRQYQNLSKEEVKLNKQYFGYISIDKQGLNRLIEYGNPNDVIEKSNVGIFGTVPSELEEESLILVGHNRPNQFASVLKLKDGDIVNVHHDTKKYQYTVRKREVISANNLDFLSKLEEKMLVLITCLEDENKRIVIFCKLQQMQ